MNKILIFAIQIVNNGETHTVTEPIEIEKRELKALRRQLKETHKAERIFFYYKQKS